MVERGAGNCAVRDRCTMRFRADPWYEQMSASELRSSPPAFGREVPDAP